MKVLLRKTHKKNPETDVTRQLPVQADLWQVQRSSGSEKGEAQVPPPRKKLSKFLGHKCTRLLLDKVQRFRFD